VIDVAAGEKIPRKGGPASPRATCSSSTRPTSRPTSAPTWRDGSRHDAHARDKPFVMTNLKTRRACDEVVRFIERKGMLASSAA
jgi:urease accessory protein